MALLRDVLCARGTAACSKRLVAAAGANGGVAAPRLSAQLYAIGAKAKARFRSPWRGKWLCFPEIRLFSLKLKPKPWRKKWPKRARLWRLFHAASRRATKALTQSSRRRKPPLAAGFDARCLENCPPPLP